MTVTLANTSLIDCSNLLAETVMCSIDCSSADTEKDNVAATATPNADLFSMISPSLCPPHTRIVSYFKAGLRTLYMHGIYITVAGAVLALFSP